ncbi:MAG: ABC transporter ATP-binding protein [Betaproteobacteria bacterium]
MISAKGLSKKFEDTLAVDNLDLDIPEGQFFGLLGPNGSGKTTTIHMLSTLSLPTSGQITIDGVDVLRKPIVVRKNIGLVFQESALDRTMTVYENLSFSAALYGIPKRTADDRINALLKLFDLSDKKRSPVARLSGGMRRAVDLIRGVLHKPKILFLDEPTVGLDLPSRRKIWRFVQQLIAEEKLTVILTTHYLEEATPCDRVCFIRKGRMVEVGAPQDLIDRLGDEIVEIEDDKPEEVVNLLGLKNSEYIVDSNVLLIRSNREATFDEIRKRLAGHQSKILVRKTNLNDVFLWISSSGDLTT